MDGLAAPSWDASRVRIVREAFTEFLPEVIINSKEIGRTRLIDRLYRAQHAFYDSVFDALEEDIHSIYVLKSRQLGLSTSIRPLIVFWAGIHDGLQGCMVYNTTFNTSVARREVVAMIRGLPPRLHFPEIVSDNREGLVLSNGSQILFMSAGVKAGKTSGGLGRSVGLNFGHFSEISSWVNEAGLTSLRQSLSEEFPDRLYIWESTPIGYNMWHSLWKEAEADDLGCRTMFFGWWSKDTQELAEGTAELARYGTEPPTPTELRRIEAVKTLYGWEVTRGQLAWYRRKTDPTQEHEEGDPEDAIMLGEQPWTADEAFQMTGAPFFQSDRLNEAVIGLEKAPKPQCFRFVPGMNFVDSEIYLARTRREIDLKLWEEPVQDAVYVVSGDPAFGHDEHNANSAAQVMRCYADGIDQVAEYASASIQPHHFAWLLWTLVGYYGSKPGATVLTICELNGPGEEVWRQYAQTRLIVQQGYLRGRAREKGIADIFSNARNYIYQRSDAMHPGHNYQWVTSNQRKVQIMEACRNYLHNKVLRVWSMDLLEEMRTITRNGDTIGAENKDRDDRTFAAALAIRAWDEKLRRGLVAQNRTREAERARLAVSIEDQMVLWQRNRLDAFFQAKERTRSAVLLAAQRAAFRSAPRRRLPERRF